MAAPRFAISMRDETIVTVIHKVEGGGPTKPRNACLVVIYGPELGRKYNIEGSEMTMGRSTANDICVPQDAVSRHHATIVRDEQGVRLRDNRSTNGTYVNDQRIGGDVWLKEGDQVRVGRSIFKFLSGENIESQYHEEIYKLSTVDMLTQVYNKRHFMEKLEGELSRARRYERPLSLLMFDIDHFKKCNDTYGHRAGDAVLREVAMSVDDRARKVDIVARYGGEEFAVILPEVDLAGATTFAEKIRSMIAEKNFVFEGQEIPTTVSIGVSELEPSVANAEDLIQRADDRLYEAKRAGRNRVVGAA